MQNYDSDTNLYDHEYLKTLIKYSNNELKNLIKIRSDINKELKVNLNKPQRHYKKLKDII